MDRLSNLCTPKKWPQLLQGNTIASTTMGPTQIIIWGVTPQESLKRVTLEIYINTNIDYE